MKPCSRSIGLQGRLCRKPSTWSYKTGNTRKFVCEECKQWITEHRKEAMRFEEVK